MVCQEPFIISWFGEFDKTLNGTLHYFDLAAYQTAYLVLQEGERVGRVVVRHFARSGVGRDLFHKTGILTVAGVGRGVFEPKALFDGVRCHFDTGLLVTDRPLGAYADDIPLIAANLLNVTGIVHTGVVALERRLTRLILHQALRTLRLRNLGGSIVIYHVDDIDLRAN